jgi:hypothetical protein
MLSLEDKNESLTKTVILLTIGVLILLVSMFALSWTAATLAQQTATEDSALTVKGTSNIAATAIAETSVPLSYASLLDATQLSRVKQIAISNIFDPSNTSAVAPPIEITYVMNIMTAVKYSDSLVEFYGVGGEILTVEESPLPSILTLDADALLDALHDYPAPSCSLTLPGQ